ncbi:MFS transporter [Sulfuracidifex metallicus]|uniref:MFS transporter n=1 Tax=Sulfuracidifex metallicus TaxID=47303 RepID=UPI002276F666|nr:MFS transporter [Sulfuracidifex metallicus]MCY0850052.1 MFS transporter [Sulfuracidifex metallicus]
MNAKLSLFSVLATFLLSSYAMYSITFVVEGISKAFNVSIPAVIFAITLSWIGGAIGGFIFGMIADKIGRKNALLLSIFFYSFLTIGVYFINNIYELYVLWFLVGMGVNGENGISYAIIAELRFTNLRGFAGGIMQGLYAIGSLLGAITAFFISYWGEIFLIAGGISLLSFLFWLWIPEQKFSMKTEMKFSSIFSPTLIRTTVLGSVISLASFLYLIPAFSLMPTVLQDLNVSSYDLVIATADLVSAIVYGLSGYLSDIKGRRITAMYFSIGAIFSSIAFLFLGREVFPVFLVYAFSAFFAFFGVWISELYPMQVRATGANFTLLIGRLIGGGFGTFLVSLIPLQLSVSLALDLIVTSIVAALGITLMR